MWGALDRLPHRDCIQGQANSGAAGPVKSSGFKISELLLKQLAVFRLIFIWKGRGLQALK